jgi:protein-tyrosine kinase
VQGMNIVPTPFDELQPENASGKRLEVALSPKLTAPDDTLWDKLPIVEVDRRRAAQRRIVTLDRYDRTNSIFDILRTKILRILRQNNWRSVAITSPTPACGKTLLGLNLAFSFANLKDCRTVLVDLDLRRPQVGSVLGLDRIHSVGQLLQGKCGIEEAIVRCGNNLAFGANWDPISYAAELLQDPDTSSVLADVKDRLNPDVMLFDLPPMLVNDDVLSFLPNVDCVILVAAAGASTISEIDICERNLSAASNFIGVVLNKCYYRFDQYGY